MKFLVSLLPGSIMPMYNYLVNVKRNSVVVVGVGVGWRLVKVGKSSMSQFGRFAGWHLLFHVPYSSKDTMGAMYFRIPALKSSRALWSGDNWRIHLGFAGVLSVFLCALLIIRK
jgi:hypothetical protein